MPKPVITVENLSKAYRIGLKEEIPDTLVSAMAGMMKAPFRKFRDLRKLDTFGHSGADEEDIYWALKDVSFEVQEGEVLGVIGRNGAGKSTLLKILSRITEPTSGRAVIRGRVSSLLEVGTGFHPELSGRENVYLNGTILGMTKREIDRKFDEIVDFSGIEKFLDTPIKRYSSGMKVRLAFAVAAHLEPEILIIDEVLAVGDAEFQAKCMGKMQDVARGGRTVLFVSHNMAAIRALCSRGLVLCAGEIAVDGPVVDSIEVHLKSPPNSNEEPGYRDLSHVARTGFEQQIRFEGIELWNHNRVRTNQVSVGEAFSIRIHVSATRAIKGEVGFTIKTSDEIPLFTCSSNDGGELFQFQSGGCYVDATIDPSPLRPGRYTVQIGTTALTCQDLIPDAISFEVMSDRHYSRGGMYSLPGFVVVPSVWGIKQSQ